MLIDRESGLESYLSNNRIFHFVTLWNELFVDLMPVVQIRRAALMIDGPSRRYDYTFYGNTKRVEGYVPGLSSPEIILRMPGVTLVHLCERIDRDIEGIRRNPAQNVYRFVKETPDFRLLLNAETPVATAAMVYRLGKFALQNYRVDVDLLRQSRHIRPALFSRL